MIKTTWITLLASTVVAAAAVSAGAQTPGQPDAPGQVPPQMFVTEETCLPCHNNLVTRSGQDVSIGSDWQVSMMAHSSKDPYWQASVRREVLAHPEAKEEIQDECAACHMPMARFRAKASGRKGKIFAHLPVGPGGGHANRLAEAGVSCTMCHQIQEEGLGEERSFTGGFVVDAAQPLGGREIFGPFDVDPGRTRLMQSAAEYRPAKAEHVQQSELCASCHTLYTHTRGAGGEVVGELPEQVPYLEWRHSAYRDTRSCQSCHMPTLDGPMHLTGVLGQQRPDFSRHVFRGGNFFMLNMLNRYRAALGVKATTAGLTESSRRTTEHLETAAATVSFDSVRVREGRLVADVLIENLAGHKLPTAYPSRRAWLHVTVRDAEGEVVFESGAIRPDGSIAGNDNDEDPDRYEPHHERITAPEQVQIYEAIMADTEGDVTTGLLSAIRFVKDNRVLPRGFDKTTAPEDIAVQGAAFEDGDFVGARDRVRYAAAIDPGTGPFRVEAELVYQPIAFRWAENLLEQQAPEIDRFVDYYGSMSESSSKVLASAVQRVR